MVKINQFNFISARAAFGCYARGFPTGTSGWPGLRSETGWPVLGGKTGWPGHRNGSGPTGPKIFF